ncbi:hypothetical protein ACFPL7_21255 [Dongia soli]|uniref:Uncharacterized protein n=1 Tax=Dongia soli TaxID=600628 RepID=A0ABU5E748_9PROT|nr:hypothetical protein [Dongia soli]MDY0882120.1 hypothetical protein [Dongia soli]
MPHMMSRRTFHLSLIVLSIILLNGLAFAGNAQQSLGGALPVDAANHAQPMTAKEIAMTTDKAVPAVAAATQQQKGASTQNEKQGAGGQSTPGN